MIKKIITHAGMAHEDEVISIALILFNERSIDRRIPIFRREPTEEELSDPDVWVLDIGGDFDSELHNFDHHQIDRRGAVCTLSLLCTYFGISESMGKYYPWYGALMVRDHLGPKALCNYLGIEELNPALFSPLSKAVLKAFEFDPNELYVFMYNMGEGIWGHIVEIESAVHLISKYCNFLYIATAPVLVYDGDSMGVREVRDSGDAQFDLSICKDDRGDGWAIYRYQDSPDWDLSLLEDDDRIHFAHKGGFIAKTKTKLSLTELAELLPLARVKGIKQ